MKQKGLGRGLDAIFGGNIEVKAKPLAEMVEIKLSEIIPNPTQPRTEFDEVALDELAESIRQLGLIQPITVKRHGEKYIIISGERRWRASERAGLEVIPAYIREVDDTTLHAMALVENIQREDLNAIEISLGMQRLIEECGLTQEALAERLGKKRSTVANYLRLLNLPEEVQFAIKGGIISMGHAKAIASAEGKTKQLGLLKKCVKNNLVSSRIWPALHRRRRQRLLPHRLMRSIRSRTPVWWSISRSSSRRISASSAPRMVVVRLLSTSHLTRISRSLSRSSTSSTNFKI